MSKFSATIITVSIVVFTLPLFFITIPILLFMYNSLVRKRNKVDFSFSGIDIMLKKRNDIIPNMIGSIKKIMTHEKELFETITKLRTKINEHEKDPETRFPLENQMSQILGEINFTMENYPEIKSDKNMLHLQRTLNETEEQISASRRAYNACVLDYNNYIDSIPSNLLAAMLSYTSKIYFETLELEKKNPNVSALFE